MLTRFPNFWVPQILRGSQLGFHEPPPLALQLKNCSGDAVLVGQELGMGMGIGMGMGMGVNWQMCRGLRETSAAVCALEGSRQGENPSTHHRTPLQLSGQCFSWDE